MNDIIIIIIIIIIIFVVVVIVIAFSSVLFYTLLLVVIILVVVAAVVLLTGRKPSMLFAELQGLGCGFPRPQGVDTDAQQANVQGDDASLNGTTERDGGSQVGTQPKTKNIMARYGQCDQKWFVETIANYIQLGRYRACQIIHCLQHVSTVFPLGVQEESLYLASRSL